jgi:hypothetical protein
MYRRVIDVNRHIASFRGIRLLHCGPNFVCSYCLMLWYIFYTNRKVTAFLVLLYLKTFLVFCAWVFFVGRRLCLAHSVLPVYLDCPFLFAISVFCSHYLQRYIPPKARCTLRQLRRVVHYYNYNKCP